jgi:hypothetical protein
MTATGGISPFHLAGLFTDWDKRFDKFRDLIYAPLDLPAPPTVDIEELKQWAYALDDSNVNQAKITYNANGIAIAESAEGVIRRRLGYYPWKSVWPKRSKDIVPTNNGWNQAFVEKFPQLVEYAKLFPYLELHAMNLLIQLEGTPVFLHVDPDDYFGMRFYISNTDNSLLYFYKTREKNDYRPLVASKDINSIEVNKVVDTSNKLYSKHPTEQHAWTLTSVRAMHGIDTMNDGVGTKITALVMGRSENGKCKYDQDKLYDLLTRSVDKYADYCIWY